MCQMITSSLLFFPILKVIRETIHLLSREKSLYTEIFTGTKFHKPSSTGKKSPQAFFLTLLEVYDNAITSGDQKHTLDSFGPPLTF